MTYRAIMKRKTNAAPQWGTVTSYKSAFLY